MYFQTIETWKWHRVIPSLDLLNINSLVQSGKGVNLYCIGDCSFTLTSSNSEVLDDIFMFREYEKGLKEVSRVSLFRIF